MLDRLFHLLFDLHASWDTLVTALATSTVTASPNLSDEAVAAGVEPPVATASLLEGLLGGRGGVGGKPTDVLAVDAASDGSGATGSGGDQTLAALKAALLPLLPHLLCVLASTVPTKRL